MAAAHLVPPPSMHSVNRLEILSVGDRGWVRGHALSNAPANTPPSESKCCWHTSTVCPVSATSIASLTLRLDCARSASSSESDIELHLGLRRRSMFRDRCSSLRFEATISTI